MSTPEIIVADFGDNLSPNSATVAGFGDSRRFWQRKSPILATVAEFGDYSRRCGQAISQVKCLIQTLQCSVQWLDVIVKSTRPNGNTD